MVIFINGENKLQNIFFINQLKKLREMFCSCTIKISLQELLFLGRTALNYAASYHADDSVLDTLVQNGADVTITSFSGPGFKKLFIVLSPQPIVPNQSVMNLGHVLN